MGLDPQESFEQVDENQDVENGVRDQVMHLNPPMEKKAPEEIGNRKTEAPKNMRKENNRFVPFLMGKRFPIRTPSMDNISRLKKMTLFYAKQVGVGTLTRLPPLNIRFISSSFTRLPPFR